ncbi:DUF6879 family protein [Jiangella alkaliphila]|uniref:DUF6879 domain-containing protein n=1 Tax=Jiangella alkaliphila TaxID=419479 RepID=A0A1H2G6Q0_9ACTN|nr:DUF6879 family protein [Jiangella alkaliphila]SDU15366.1 hypothetical protein SAMN04488563_0331 [Jiangella alkaliphila]
MIAFDELLAQAQRSAVHLEMRDSYMLDDPTFVAWQRGETMDPVEQWRPWVELVQAALARGVAIRRARIISEPVSAYVRWEYETTTMNVEAGEQVRWLPRRRATDIPLPGNDFWLFDDSPVLVNHFDGNGQKPDLGYELIDDDPTLAKLCASAFEAVWERAIPHEEYRP